MSLKVVLNDYQVFDIDKTTFGVRGRLMGLAEYASLFAL